MDDSSSFEDGREEVQAALNRKKYHNPSIAINIKDVNGEITGKHRHETPASKYEKTKSETRTQSDCTFCMQELDQ